MCVLWEGGKEWSRAQAGLVARASALVVCGNAVCGGGSSREGLFAHARASWPYRFHVKHGREEVRACELCLTQDRPSRPPPSSRPLGMFHVKPRGAPLAGSFVSMTRPGQTPSASLVPEDGHRSSPRVAGTQRPPLGRQEVSAPRDLWRPCRDAPPRINAPPESLPLHQGARVHPDHGAQGTLGARLHFARSPPRAFSGRIDLSPSPSAAAHCSCRA